MFHRVQAVNALAWALTLLLIAATPARAIGLLRDADIEYGLAQLAAPILRASGLSPEQVRVLVVDDNTLNAFVADTQTIFINAGLILKLNNARSLQAVLAHEAAHIANGHITRRAGNARTARTAAGLGMVLAGAAAAAGQGRAAAGLAVGTASSARGVFLGHTRAEEASADQSSLRTMLRAGIDPQGAVEVMEIFRGQEALSVGRQDPYMLSHPLSRDRFRAMQAFVAGAGAPPAPDGTANYWFARIKGKLSAFARAPAWTLRRADEGPTKDIELIRKAAAYHKQSDATRAIKAIDGAIALRPRDPFLLDLKGQILLESRRADAAVQTLQQAAALAPRDALILGGLGRAQLAAGNPRAALATLEKARSRDFRDARILRDLGTAYAQDGQNGMASLVTAERYALQGRLPDAEIHAKRAEALLARGSGAWQRAQDVLNAAKQTQRR
ncbi:M48 family metalloprotease [Puniceibacterium sp. IMCC21224]|uniref:M48 family metalloprotease n=1 Tax=Puniceibacterium sp. IMCC21224 TaxID=1618204 RepID=UPI00065D7770|nr:M48 family metalloprotease [Puniceibacterium sp. IMCC21224]KMK67519.1 putative Zn-dependent protease [Puniceibacterium sp. IMCC21224]